MEYPALVPVVTQQSFPIEQLWSPYCPKLKDVPIIYVFRKGDRALYIGKTDGYGRDRLRWHLRNTFVATELTGLVVDVLVIDRYAIRAQVENETSLEHYEAILIRQFMPVYNNNIRKTYRRLMHLPLPDDSALCLKLPASHLDNSN